MAGEFFFACSNKSLTREAPTPTNISTKSEPLMLKKGTPASPATAFASNVLPVPGGPTKSTPLGILAPKLINLPGAFKNSTTSSSSAFSSSAPATSSNLYFLLSSLSILAFDLPNCIALPPPPCAWLIKKIQKRINIIIITNVGSIEIHQGVTSGGSGLNTSFPESICALIVVPKSA